LSTVPPPQPGLDIPRPAGELLPLAEAARTLGELLRGCAIPVDTDQLLYTDTLLRVGCVLFGDVPVRPVKVRRRWWVDAPQIHQAAAALHAVPIDFRDLVPLIPESGGRRRRPPLDTWRGSILNTVEPEWSTPRQAEESEAPGERGGTGDETAEWVIRWCDWHTMGSTRYLDLLVPYAGAWHLPRGYAELLDRWQRQIRAVVRQAQRCSGCGAKGPDGNEWREATAHGYVTTCPDCVTAGTRTYAGEFDGMRYDKGLGLDPAAYRCVICSRRAMYVDHCHDHGYVRGPLCGTCNTAEGSGGSAGTGGRGFPEQTHTPEWLRYLRRCVGCRTQDTLPLAHVQTLGVRLFMGKHQPRHGRCRSGPRVTVPDPLIGTGTLVAGLPLRITLECRSHPSARWEVPVTLETLLGLVRAYIAETVPELTAAGTAG
jgi:hypothetical protein